MTKATRRLMLIVLILAFAAGNYGCAGGTITPGSATLGDGAGPAGDTRALPEGGEYQVIRHTADGIEVPFSYLADDPGWTQPWIEPRRETPMPPPTREMLQEYLKAERERGLTIKPRLEMAKGASWMDQGGFDGMTAVVKGEYNLSPRDVDPPYGCNSDGTNGVDDHAFEDVIRYGSTNLPYAISYVLEGHGTANWFNTTGGSANSAQSAVYQLFSTSREANPADWSTGAAQFEELTYRSDLAPGVPPGGDCSSATAYLVNGIFWKRFNSTTNALPNMQSTLLYNILIAPAGEKSASFTSSGNTDARFQQFNFGNVSGCYGGAWITGLESADTPCSIFNESVNSAYAAGDPFHFRPVYGLLLKRWQETQTSSGMAGPWDGGLGWPVAGPVAYVSGTQHLGGQGAYYAWGMWYERGFCWWVDYDQTCYPTALDEAQLYGYSGVNVYDQVGDYFRWGPAVYYGYGGELGATVVIDYYRYNAGDPWMPVRLNDDGTAYVFPNPQGMAAVSVAMHCTGYGGTPNADWTYDFYHFDFGDSTAYEGPNPYCIHTYFTDVPDLFVRVEITDDDSETAFADSLPLHFDEGPERKAVLLVSQSHGFDADFSGTNAWDAFYGFTVQSGSVPAAGRDMIWAAGLATDAGVGPGGEDGVFPTAPQNVSGTLSGIFCGDSSGCAERYSGIGSSGMIPLELTFGSASQFCGLGYYGSLMAGNEASPGFRAGVAVETAVPCAPVAFISWGNVFAPDSGIGFSPDYSHTLGERRLWVVGYPWALASPDTGERAEVLQNILGWLDSTVDGGPPPAELMVIRADGAIYDANYDALTDDLDALGASYSTWDYTTTVAEEFNGGAYKIAIWYRGGPGDGTEPQTYTTAWTSEELTEFLELLE